MPRSMPTTRGLQASLIVRFARLGDLQQHGLSPRRARRRTPRDSDRGSAARSAASLIAGEVVRGEQRGSASTDRLRRALHRRPAGRSTSSSLPATRASASSSRSSRISIRNVGSSCSLSPIVTPARASRYSARGDRLLSVWYASLSARDLRQRGDALGRRRAREPVGVQLLRALEERALDRLRIEIELRRQSPSSSKASGIRSGRTLHSRTSPWRSGY